MRSESSLNDVFRFVHLGPSRPVDPPLVTFLETELASSLRDVTSVSKRKSMARAALIQGNTVRSIGDLQYGRGVLAAIAPLRARPQATVGEMLASLSGIERQSPEFAEDYAKLSDTLLAASLSPPAPKELSTIGDLFRVYGAAALDASAAIDVEIPLRRLLRSAIPLPFDRFSSGDGGSGRQASLAYLRSARIGVTDLLVVKQQIKRYEAVEIAHVENVLSGETRSRVHRHLVRTEEIRSFETETTKAVEKELETTERFEMNRETSKTIADDQKFGFNLSVSARYGPMVEVNAATNVEVEHAVEETVQSTTNYAKDVVQRSVERVEERVREERIRKMLLETEETNTHGFENPAANPHIVGIYQYLDKIYEAQVFNYGKREMFDLMIPEPASYLWHLLAVPPTGGVELPPEPEDFDVTPLGIGIDTDVPPAPNHYAELAARFGATGIAPPPPCWRIETASLQRPRGARE